MYDESEMPYYLISVILCALITFVLEKQHNCLSFQIFLKCCHTLFTTTSCCDKCCYSASSWLIHAIVSSSQVFTFVNVWYNCFNNNNTSCCFYIIVTNCYNTLLIWKYGCNMSLILLYSWKIMCTVVDDLMYSFRQNEGIKI